MSQSPLIGRRSERSQLANSIKRAAAGRGQMLLLAGEAGIGKTRLASHMIRNFEIASLRASANETVTPPYSLFIEIFRKHLRSHKGSFSEMGPLKSHLAQLLPEVSETVGGDDPYALIEAIRVALEIISDHAPTVIFFDDLQWGDNATLRILPILAEWLPDAPLLLLAAYRSDEVTRKHPVSYLKHDLRRANHLNEITLKPLSQVETHRLAEKILQADITPALSHALYQKTQGVPFFVEELIATLRERHHRVYEGGCASLVSEEMIPLPESVRDAILLRFDRLSPSTKEFLEIAAAAGQEFSFELIERISGVAIEDEAIRNGFISVSARETGQFRHGLTREAIYNEIGWTRSRHIHRKIAHELEVSNASPYLIAEHWHAGKKLGNARRAYLEAVDESCQIHAYADAARSAKRAIDIWPEGEDEMERLALLDQLGRCAQLSGSLNDATRAWREAAESYRSLGASLEYAEVNRKLATVYELQGIWGKARTSRQTAAEAFMESRNKEEAISELLALAGHLHASGKYGQGIPMAKKALALAEAIEDKTQQARAMGLLGSLKTRTGSPDEGLSTTRSGLSLALAEDAFSIASEIYQRLAAIMEHLGDYAEAEEIYTTGVEFCQAHGLSAYAHLCQACASVVIFQRGDFQEVISVNDAIVSADDAPQVTKLIARTWLGLARCIIGESIQAKEDLSMTLPLVTRNELTADVILCNWGLGILAWQANDIESAASHAHAILRYWSQSDEAHYSIPCIRYCASLFSSLGDGEHTRASANALARIATTLSTYESLAGLSHGLGEVAWVNGQLPQAIDHFEKALELIADKGLPLQEVETKYRAGLAYFANDQMDTGGTMLSSAYRTSRAIGERSYSQRIVLSLMDHGVSLEKSLGRREAARAKYGGLTKRQVEVLRLVAEGMTNQQIAEALFISRRTVDMHVSNILAELGCRSRTEAVYKATGMGLLSGSEAGSGLHPSAPPKK